MIKRMLIIAAVASLVSFLVGIWTENDKFESTGVVLIIPTVVLGVVYLVLIDEGEI